MRKLSVTELKRKTLDEFKSAEKNSIIVVLDNIRSLNNIGSVFRTSDAFLVKKIILCGITATPPHRDIQKTALGATDSVDWEYSKKTIDAIKKLKDDSWKIISVEQAENSTMLEDFNINRTDKYVLVFGNEVNGVDQNVIDISDACIEIPQFGTKHSLNISVSAGIVIWEMFSKLQKC